MTTIETHGPYGSAQATPGANGWSVDVTPTVGPDGPASRAAHLTAALDAIAEAATWAGGGRLEYWVEAAENNMADCAAAEAAGFSPYRDLWQLRCPLPAKSPETKPRSPIINTRPFSPTDLDDFLAVNNRAFHWHPEQSGRTQADIESIQSESWYDPAGFLLHEIDGQLAGFCWTKIHRAENPPLGEIYVIGVDPAFHGRGLGEALTRAGLTHMHGQGIANGMLYVESDNAAANRTYERIGFVLHQTNRAYERTVAKAPELG